MSRFVLQLSEVLAEMESLQEELKHRKEQADIQKNLIAEAEEKQQKTEEKLAEEISKLKEKASTLTKATLKADLENVPRRTAGNNSYLPILICTVLQVC